MAGQYRFKDLSGNVVAQISASADGTISFSGSQVNFSQANTINLGNVQLAGTASNSLLLNGYGAQSFALTSSIHPFTASIAGTNTFTSSTSARLNSIETITASNIARISSLESTSASVDSLNTTQNTRLTNLENKTGSLATTGSNTFSGDQIISGTVYIQNNLVVQGSSSLQNITASAVNIGTNTILLNTATPSIRFAGISAIDSGSSAGKSGSLYFDSTDNEWIFIHQLNTAVTSSTVITGPETYDNVGNETRLTTNAIPKAQSGFHIVDSCIIDNGTTTCIKNNLITTGTINSANITSTGTITSVCSVITGTPANSSSLLLENFNGDQTATTLKLKSGRADVFYHMQAFSSNTSEVFRIESTGKIVGAAGATFSGQVCGVMGNFSCVGIGTTSTSNTYGTLTIAGTGVSIADDGNAKLQIGRYSSTACNAYIKMGTNACSLRISNNTDLADVFIIEKGGNTCVGGDMTVSSIYLACSVDAKICTGTNIGLNIDGSGLYLNRYSLSNILMVPNGGNVGICNTNPRSALSFANSISDKIDFYNDGLTRYTAQINSGELRFYTTATNDVISLYAGNTIGLVNKNGSIGIGHASPVDKMDVMGSLRIRCNTPNFTAVCNSLVIDFVPTAVFGSNPMARYYAIGCTGVSAGHAFTVGQPTSPFNALTIFGDGKVGVNTDNCATGTVGNPLVLRSSSSNAGQTALVIQDYRKCNRWAVNGQSFANDATLTIYSTPNNTNDYTPVFSITQSGQVQKFCNAAFQATINANTNIGTGGATIQFNCVLYNAGGGYNGTTSVFTAPVSGLYQFNFVFLNQNTQNTTGGHAYLSTNYGVGTYYFTRYGCNSGLSSTGYGGYVPMFGSFAVYLPSGCSASVKAFWDADGAFSHNSTAWGNFSGYLVG